MLVFPGFRGLDRSFCPRTSTGISAWTSTGYPAPKLTLWAAFSFLIISGPIWFPISGRRPETYFLGRLDRKAGFSGCSLCSDDSIEVRRKSQKTHNLTVHEINGAQSWISAPPIMAPKHCKTSILDAVIVSERGLLESHEYPERRVVGLLPS